MSIFRWMAPLFKLAGRRWSQDDFQCMAGWLRPYVPSGGVLADLGGGTGELGAGLARELGAGAVIIDPTPQMLRRVDALPWVSVRLASAEALPFPDAFFHALVCSDAFHHLRDQEAAAREIARVVRPGGGVLILDMHPVGRDRIWGLLEKLLGEPAAFRAPDDLQRFLASHSISGDSERARGSGYSFVGTVTGSARPDDAGT
jgi:ubiquinone/menaquinone biosynthesis C-methylase UbiE